MSDWNEFTPASIYNYQDGSAISEGLQNCLKCDEAMLAAKDIAKERGESVVLDDADGLWVVSPDGSRTECDWS